MDQKILVTRSSMPPLREYVDEIASMWDSHWLTNMGEKHQAFEAVLKNRLNVDYLTLFVNGHNALECALEAFDLHGEVITTPFTFTSTTHAIVRKGLVPVFADIKESDLTLDPDSIEKAITPRTCAIVPVHVYGNLCDVDAIQDIANRYGLTVIYDAAHAFGVERKNPLTRQWESAAVFGNASMFSFHATKVFNTIEGGCVCFHDPSLADKLNQLKNFGIVGQEEVESIGTNAKMNEFCAAMGLCNLRHLDEEIAKRQKVANRYWELLEDIPGITIFRPPESIKSNYAYLPVLFDADIFGATRDEVYDALANAGIGTRKYFYPLISDCACYRDCYSSEKTPIAKDKASKVLTLPLYSDLPIKAVDSICKILRSFPEA